MLRSVFKNSVWRSVVFPIVILAMILGALWYRDSGREVPLLRERNVVSDSIGPDDGFFSLESRGIKLGGAGGPAPKIGEPAPDFTLLDLNGKVVHLSDFHGKTVIINFWATWCTPCRREFPEFVELYERNKENGLVIVGVNLQESAGSVRKFVDDYGAKFPIVLDKAGSVANQYRLTGSPVSWFVDADGIVRGQVIGLVTKALLKTNLAEAGFELREKP